ncbi:mandelate racemase/muconate lactonizing enzyme family protein, partial [Burkholderia sp. SIMBA_043]
IVEIPFHDGGKGQGITPTTWHTLENVLIRLEDEHGNVGWGEAFGYFVADATKALIDRLITPLLAGRQVDDIAAFNRELQLRLHLFG